MTEQNKPNREQQGLFNLKTIYSIQHNGELQQLLRDLRTTKNSLDELTKNVDIALKNSMRVKQEQLLMHEKVDNSFDNIKENNNEKVEQSLNDIKVNEIQDSAYENNRIFSNKRNFSNNNEERTFNKFNNLNNYNSNYNKQYGNNNQRYGQNNNFQNNNSQRPYNNFNRSPQSQYRNNQQGQRTFNNFNRPPQGANNGFRTSNFLSSKGNNFKSFSPMESSSVLAKDSAKSFANKKPVVKTSYEEKKQMNKKALLRKNIIFDNSNVDIDGERMGSRKLTKSKKKEEVIIAPKIENAVITSKTLSVKTLSEKTGRPVSDIIKKLMILGIMATINSSIDFDTASLVAEEMGVTLELKLEQTNEEKLEQFIKEVNEENLITRAPVVTVMGHVDHGKTSLLDAIRKTNVVSGEAGGITQKIGAYSINYNGDKITFIDTPGHAAFTSMRARGAKVTDIAILVVAADDGIMPQTIEAINHIKAANCPMIVAINKMDKSEANPERIKQQLAENGVMPEEWGGNAILVPVSAKTGIGIDKLLDSVLLVAEMQELKADPTTSAVGTVLEAELSKTRGPVATVLVQSGTLKIGDFIMSGITYGKVKAMYDENGKMLKTAGPSCPVSVLGLNEVPNSGDQVCVVSEKLSKQVIEERVAKIKEERANSTSGVTLDDFMDRVNEGKLKALNLIIKADVQGSVEALKQSLCAIRNEEARVVCIHSGAGAVTESDVILAEASSAVIINFNLKPTPKVESLAEHLGVQMKSYKVIYECVEEITNAINGMLSKKYEDKIIGHAEVRMMFKLSSAGVVCGSYVTDGVITRKAFVNVYRGDDKILSTQIDALKIQKDDKPEVHYGYECGIKLNESTGVAVGDRLEVYEKVEIKRV